MTKVVGAWAQKPRVWCSYRCLLKAGICIGPGTPAGTVEPWPNAVALATGNGLTTMKSFFVSVLEPLCRRSP
jgi:hypothetical protein